MYPNGYSEKLSTAPAMDKQSTDSLKITKDTDHLRTLPTDHNCTASRQHHPVSALLIKYKIIS